VGLAVPTDAGDALPMGPPAPLSVGEGSDGKDSPGFHAGGCWRRGREPGRACCEPQRPALPRLAAPSPADPANIAHVKSAAKPARCWEPLASAPVTVRAAESPAFTKLPDFTKHRS